MIAHYLINPDMRHNMDILSETYLKYSPQSIEALIGKKRETKNQCEMLNWRKSKNMLLKMLM
jgi:DNA polymerase-1